MSVRATATIDDLYRVPDHVKAELVGGDLVIMSPTGDMPSTASGAIFASLFDYARRTGSGRAYPDNAAFIVDLPNRKSFSPDAAFYTGPRSGMRFLQGAPVFAAEVHSEGDYGVSAEGALARKLAEYFAAGALVVWDVDLLSEKVVRVYRASSPDRATVYQRGEIAEAEPAVSGWRFPVDDLFV